MLLRRALGNCATGDRVKCCPAPPCPQQRNAPLRMPLAPSPHYPGLPPTVPRERDQRHEKHCRAAAEPPPANEFTKAAIKAQDEQLAALMAPRLAQAQRLQREALLLPSHAVPQAVGAGFGNALMVAGCGCACGRGGISMQASCAVQRGNLVCPLAWLRRLGCFALHASTPVWPLRPSLNAPSTLLPSLPPPMSCHRAMDPLHIRVGDCLIAFKPNPDGKLDAYPVEAVEVFLARGTYRIHQASRASGNWGMSGQHRQQACSVAWRYVCAASRRASAASWHVSAAFSRLRGASFVSRLPCVAWIWLRALPAVVPCTACPAAYHLHAVSASCRATKWQTPSRLARLAHLSWCSLLPWASCWATTPPRRRLPLPLSAR